MQPLQSGLATLSAEGITHDRNGRCVLLDVSLTVSPGQRVAVVGPNGVGKSTLLEILAGQIGPDAGRVRVDPTSTTLGLLAQDHEKRPNETIAGHLGRLLGVTDAEHGLASAAEALAEQRCGAEERYDLAWQRYESVGAPDFHPRMATVLDDLGLGDSPGDTQVERLSGGQRSRLALAAIVLSRFDITLLDEPTNDLDFDGLARLEAFVASNEGGMVIVSHDRAFLANCASEVLEIHERDHTAQLFGGGWEGYLTERAHARAHAEEAYARYTARRSELRARAQRERQWATKGVSREKRKQRDNDKAQRDFRVNRTERLASRARRTERAMQSLETVDKPWEGWHLRYSISHAQRAGAVVARLDEALVERGSFRLGPIDLEIAWADRMALTGPNGSGKTTLVKTLLGELPLARGARWIGPSVKIGQLDQDRRPADTRQTVLEVFIAATRLTVGDARTLLAKFGIGADHVHRPAGSMSPGERTRVELAKFQATGVNFLVLDEPTNHLDLPAIEQLENALERFDGTLLLVSHDRRMLESVAFNRRLEIGRSGQVRLRSR